MPLLLKKKISAVVILGMLVLAGTAASRLPGFKHKNLQVLPKDISDEKLDSIMLSYNAALGVSCNFCHVSFTGFPDSLDYASDKDPMKENAREMMRMTIYINKTYFYFDKQKQPEFLNVIRCMTCHKGEPYPLEEDQ